MAQLGAVDRLYPSLLDRLRDDNPTAKKESRDKRIISMPQLRKHVLRDLDWLLNTVHCEATVNFEAYPHVANSVVNYGIPGLSGLTIDSGNKSEIAQKIKQAILTYEPRINSRTLRVTVTFDKDLLDQRARSHQGGHKAVARNSMFFEIEGELWGQPMPSELYLKTEVDLTTGEVCIPGRENGYE